MPVTRYARSGDLNIAYQVFGDGPLDMIFVPGFVTHLELSWRLPAIGQTMEEMGRFARVLKFDKRGTGMSDPVAGAPTLEARMDDVRAVMDAAGSTRAALYGLSEGASLAVLFAATYPERTAALVIRSAIARTLRTPDYPWGVTEEEYARRVERELRIYGPRQQALDAVRLLGAFDEAEAEAFLDYLRYSASPGMLEALLRLNREIDIRHVLAAVRVPTLVLHGAEDRVVPREAALYLAERIPGARFVEVPGAGHLAVGDAAARINAELERFLTEMWHAGAWDEPAPDTVLATVLFTDIVDSTEKIAALGDRGWRELLEAHHAIVRRELQLHRGIEMDTAGDGFFARFDGPARAIRCACAIAAQVRSLGIEIRAGLHTGECELADGKVAGIAVSIGARVAAEAAPGEVLVSSTVRDLVAGSGLAFQDRGLRTLKGVQGEWRLFSVSA